MTVAVTYNFEDSNIEAKDIDFGVSNVGPDITGLSNGGIAGIGNQTGLIFNAAGNQIAAWSPLAGTNASIDQLSDGNLIVAAQDADSIIFKIVDSVTGAEIVSAIDLGLPGSTNADVMALSGVPGGFWIVSETNFGGTDNDISVSVRGNNGAFQSAFSIDSSLANDTGACVAQLDGGNVVVAWTRTIGTDTETWFTIRSTSGTEVLAPTLFDTNGAVNQNVSITALNGGGFALVYQDSEWSAGELHTTLATFNASGNSVGKFDLTQAGNSVIEPSVSRLANGMLAVAEVRGNTTFVSLVDPNTGQVLAQRDVLDSPVSGDNPHNPVVAAIGTGSVAIVYNDTVANFSGGQVHNIVRESVSNSARFAGDTIIGDNFIDRITGGEGDDTLDGGGNNDTISGGVGVDTINGGDGNDIIEGGEGYDFITGGNGNDTIFLMTAADADSNLDNGETHGNAGDDRITGSAGLETLYGDSGNDTLDGGSGGDILDGGADSDTAAYTNAAGSVTATLTNMVSGHTGGSSSGANGNDTFIDIENLTGSAFADTLTGNSGANVLIGGGAADTMAGLGGNDSYSVDNALDSVIEAAGGGMDRVYASVSYVLGAGQEVETLSTNSNAGAAAINLTGNALVNTLIGNSGSNVLIGGGGADTMTGLAGNDSYGVDNALDTVIESIGGGVDRIYASVSYSLAAGQEVETLSTNSNSGTGAINLTGNAFNNALIGNSGANFLIGGSGADMMTGLNGNDSYGVDNALDLVIEAVGGGSDRVYSSVSYTLAAGREIEILSTDSNSGTSSINLTGNAFDNVVYGNFGSNILIGGGGNDRLIGLDGNDNYLVDSASDYVFENLGSGTDRVYASCSYTLAASQEIEILSTTNNAGTAALNLTGNQLNNTLIGNAGANLLLGGDGVDTLTGLNGADTFVFNTNLSAGANHDAITDFVVADDSIRLENAIFTLLTATGALAQELFKDLSLAAQDANDVIVYNRTTGELFYDTNGLTAGGQTLFADVTDGTALTFADFVVS